MSLGFIVASLYGLWAEMRASDLARDQQQEALNGHAYQYQYVVNCGAENFD
jgi:mono/diheme cytochrome c family protein